MEVIFHDFPQKTNDDFQVISETSPGSTFSRFGVDLEGFVVPFSMIFGTSGLLLTSTKTRAGVPPSKVGTHSFQDLFMPFRDPGTGCHFS